MKFLALATALFGGHVALGARFTDSRRERNAARLAARSDRLRSSRLAPTNSTGHEINGPESFNLTKNTQYSQNWAGAILIGTGYQAVTGTFTVPSPKVPFGGNSNTAYAASAWVGIDGDTSTSSILQVGLDFYIWKGQIAFDAWYEWYPDYAYIFTGINFSVGDSVTLFIQATSSTTGVAIVANNSKGTSASHTFNTQPDALQGVNAEWIVEDFQTSTNALVPFANFGGVTFTNAYAANAEGILGPTGANLVDIEQNGLALTSTSINSNTVNVKYIR